MFREEFSHYLSYGATDQRTVTALAGEFDGLIVPGTVAAFQWEGTGGFVLALSAATGNFEYAIDPRFPLFQQRLPFPKKSHSALASLLGVPSLVRPTVPRPEDFTPELIDTVARCWAEFAGSYNTAAGRKFDKYARRLGEPSLTLDNARPPGVILPPYLVSAKNDDEWWEVSSRLFDATRQAVASPERCARVVAVDRHPSILLHALRVHDDRVALWVSGLDELSIEAEELAAYGEALRALRSAGKATFALYGGFFSVMLQNVGLGGSSHGIGYGESRQWIELPESGPPPSRYYVPQLHRYLQPDEATRLLMADRRLAECRCAECGGDPPNTLDYHALMRHSVRCRAQEIQVWQGLEVGEMAERLARERDDWVRILEESRLVEVLIRRGLERASHLNRWVRALELLTTSE